MKRILLILFCVLALPVMASHIVGGEFELIHLSGNTYQLNLIIYFDEINGNPGAQDPNVVARIFRKKDNAVMMDVNLPLVQSTNVAYTQVECTIGELKTKKLLYSSTLTLSNANFSDPEGYYVAWERCCRNYQITNIFSENTQAGGSQYAGQAFYLEFPPVTKDGVPFYNSTPRLFPPLSDYACPYRLYYVDFAGIDDDGDSLAYSLVTPLNTHTNVALPLGGVAAPRPYPDVTWRPGFNLDKVVGGNPDLAITTDGFLTVTPTQQGLFVFAVKCEEFRDKQKIGEVRRDFQMLVLDACPVAEPPLIVGKKVSDPTTFKDKMNISFTNQVSDADRCMQVVVSDPDAHKIEDNYSENIKLKVIPLGYKKDMSGILPDNFTATLTKDNGTKTFDICFEQCPPNESGIFQVGIIAFDDACSLPLSDTLRITVNVQPPFNAKPKFESPAVNVTTRIIDEGEEITYRIKATDANNDQMTVGIIPDGFTFNTVGMTVNQIQNVKGIYEADFVWDSRCDVYDFENKSSFQLKFIVQDQDQCAFSGSDTVAFNLGVILPGNADPVISTDLTPDKIVNGVYTIERKIFDKLDFNVTGADLQDKDFLVLTGKGLGFDLTPTGATFPSKSGNASITSTFDWKLLCEKLNLENKNEFDLQFIVKDEANKCRFYKADTLNVRLKVLPPDNGKPVLTITNTNPDLKFENNFQEAFIGQQISLGLVSVDPNTNPQDLVRIELIDATGNVQPSGYVFSDVIATGTAQTTFSWLPECSIFEKGVNQNDYFFSFRTLDSRCQNTLADTVIVNLRIRDYDNDDKDFIPPNFVSANGDSFNDYFAMVRQNEDGELENILPGDNCEGRFVSISIYNRWGREIFTSFSRDFEWHPVNQAPGVYFYTLVYSNKEYKGTVTVKD
jgi:hypothetical protein